jgi:ADP-heptose:LPS heptosyltransferase
MSAASIRRNILIFHAGALGDFVLTWPLTLALSRLHPQSRIVYITHSSKGALASRYIGSESSSIEAGGWHSLFSDRPSLQPQVEQLLQRAQSIYSYLSKTDDLFTRNIQSLAPEAELRCLVPLPPPDFDGHVTNFYLQQIDGVRALSATYTQILTMLTQRGVGSIRSTSPRILLHPGAGSSRKCWPLHRYLELAKQLTEQERDVAFLLGEAEQEQFEPSQVHLMQDVGQVIRPASYLQLADELLQCRLLVTNDNGPGHLAGILGANVLSIFGPTNPTQWRPLGPSSSVLHAPVLDDLSAKEVAEIALACAKSVPSPARQTVPDDEA